MIIKMRKKVAVIGGGAAGMMAAIQSAHAGACVELYEKNDRVGKKLLATGNGKCNLSNLNMHKDAYYGSAVTFYDTMFGEFGVNDTIDLFGQLGMLIKNKSGYLYPLSEQASTVLDVLRSGLERYEVLLHTGMDVKGIQIEHKSGKFTVNTSNPPDAGGGLYDAVVLACGGRAAPKSGSDGSGYKIAKALGHHVTEVVPALVQLCCSEDFFKGLAGVRTDAVLTLYIDGREEHCERGELQLTDYGISGIPVFQFSRRASYALLHKKKVTVDIDFLPDYEDTEYGNFWKLRWERQSYQPLEQFLTGITNKKINQLIIKLAGCRALDKAGDIPDTARRRIESLYRKFTVSVCATKGFEHAQVSAGGIPAKELTATLESRLVPNLYFAGEIIDMDGICGGYNLQWAWTSGVIAGRAAARKQ